MCNSFDRIPGYSQVSEQEQAALTSSAASIVLLQKHAEQQGINTLSTAIAPGTHLLGFMLPYTPLHHYSFQARIDIPAADVIKQDPLGNAISQLHPWNKKNAHS